MQVEEITFIFAFFCTFFRTGGRERKRAGIECGDTARVWARRLKFAFHIFSQRCSKRHLCQFFLSGRPLWRAENLKPLVRASVTKEKKILCIYVHILLFLLSLFQLRLRRGVSLNWVFMFEKTPIETEESFFCMERRKSLRIYCPTGKQNVQASYAAKTHDIFLLLFETFDIFPCIFFAMRRRKVFS